MMEDYALLDSGNGRKLERFGAYVLDRPALGAIWKPQLRSEQWKRAHAVFTREGKNNWQGLQHLPKSWTMQVEGITFKLMPTDFGHIGVFPEQAPHWKWIQEKVRLAKKCAVLNLFAYSGGASLAAALGGASVCHLDASKGMVAWARENAEGNSLTKAPIRWIVDDAAKFLKREQKRGARYDAIILDPPSFGRGAKGEVFKIEEDLPHLLDLCRELLSSQPVFVLLSCHTPGMTPLCLQHLLGQMMQGKQGEIVFGEMTLSGKQTLALPSGAFARWSA
jgi:23S rRNA (cytosine1962-C5)-methyltransferase